MISPVHLHRVYHRLWKKGIRFVPGALARINYFITGCDLPPACTIGKRVQFQHFGSGVVLHPAVSIGDDVMIMPGVVIGQQVKAGIEIVPVTVIRIEDGALIGAGAKVIAAGKLTVGSGSAVGANAVVTQSVPPGATAVGIPARIVSNGRGAATAP